LGFSKKVGVTFLGKEEEIVKELENLECRDRNQWSSGGGKHTKSK